MLDKVTILSNAGLPMPKVIKKEADHGEGEAASAGRIGKVRVEAVMKAAERSGLLSKKGSRIGGRVSRALVERAKKQTGIETDTDLIEFALASVALEDRFAEVFTESRGKVDQDLKLGF